MTTETKNMQARIPVELHTWLKMQAIREDTTLGDLVNKALRQYREKVEK